MLKLLLGLIVIMGIYFVVGSFINNRKYGLTGIESIPNYSFWMEFPHLIGEGIKFSFFKLTAGIRRITSLTVEKSSSSSGTYNII